MPFLLFDTLNFSSEDSKKKRKQRASIGLYRLHFKARDKLAIFLYEIFCVSKALWLAYKGWFEQISITVSPKYHRPPLLVHYPTKFQGLRATKVIRIAFLSFAIFPNMNADELGTMKNCCMIITVIWNDDRNGNDMDDNDLFSWHSVEHLTSIG